jgi:AraC-like DNA-binding protein
MNIASTLPDDLSESQAKAIGDLIGRLEFLPVSCLFCRGDEARVIRPNRVIPDDFIYLPAKGALDCTVAGEHRMIKPGEFMMVPAGQPHGVTMANGVDCYEVFALHMHLYDETRHRFLRKLGSSFGSVSDLDAWIARLSACTCLMGRSPEQGGAYMKNLVVALLIEQILRGRTLESLPEQTDQRIVRLLAQIIRKPAEDLSVTHMAKVCHLSVSRFRQLFTAITGSSPKRYVQRVRLSLARSMLATMPALTVEQVAAEVGISDAHHFHAIYKSMFGETPRRSTFRQ